LTRPLAGRRTLAGGRCPDTNVAYKDYYQVLGIPRTATEEALKQAYRQLARKYHPDVSKEKDAEQRFKDLNEANDVLKDPKKRALYDQYGEAWKAAAEGHAPPPGAERARQDFSAQGFEFDPNDVGDLGSVFETFFRGRNARASRRGSAGFSGFGSTDVWPETSADREATIQLSVEDAFRGGERSISLQDGSSAEQRTYNVRIPAGVRSGQRVRLAGQGGRSAEGAGDLYLRIELQPSQRFRLEGDDVHSVLPVTPWEAALGATVTLRTLDGTVRIKVPAGSSSGRKIRLKAKGYPSASGERGDLYAELRVDVPTDLGDEERDLIQRWASMSKFNPRAEDER
jgi:curved DNA-binding protein